MGTGDYIFGKTAETSILHMTKVLNASTGSAFSQRASLNTCFAYTVHRNASCLEKGAFEGNAQPWQMSVSLNALI